MGFLAQQRPGLSPRRHLLVLVCLDKGFEDAQQRPGLSPRRHMPAPGSAWRKRATLNKGRGSHPGDTARPAVLAAAPAPLNKGRGSHPGDTRGWTGITGIGPRAQQRPGLSPRRHEIAEVAAGTTDGRSTKAGALTPATLDQLPPRVVMLRRRSTKAGALTPATHGGGRRSKLAPIRALNKGRGSHPGDTVRFSCKGARRGYRSTKAGALTPATRRRRRPGRRLPGQRSTKAGALTPATPGEGGVIPISPRARSTKAGALTPATHIIPPSPAVDISQRSTKAGALTPATHLPGFGEDLGYQGRSTKAGALTPATPGGGPVEVGADQVRSTKAGALTPATLHRLGLINARVEPLNKGRGSHPGDTPGPTRLSSPSALSRAQQRPGLSPRRHIIYPGIKPFHFTRSTKAGALTPATPDNRILRGNLLTDAQQRPGLSPRRHLNPCS